ncbi:hypothetical protein SJ05684_c04370 [Sinorhizobium sojae CCBAU 05684]|uniref:Uncharacterized protein n=1 Tax=Sinorhizobium sojae CCBAU 05684 TaxID=716928 RepID=A0A249P7J6_9HYPH|nr:hypothetical protein SJ05684_c04370 [Sinorhizobium sojae CCBAU 05684]
MELCFLGRVTPTARQLLAERAGLNRTIRQIAAGDDAG